jgi:LuxR family maltose regulon positive regulatory protein
VIQVKDRTVIQVKEWFAACFRLVEGVMPPSVQPGPAVPTVSGIVARRELLDRLAGAGRVTVVSAPAGSGKTFLLRSWMAQAGMAGRAAWAPVLEDEQDPQRFWIMVTDALRGTTAAAQLVRPLSPAPDLDGWQILERLLKNLAPLADRVWLVIDDLHELKSPQTLELLELLILRAPGQLRFVLATRHDLGLRLHRLRLEGELTEIRAADLRLTLAEARALFDAAGVAVPDTTLALLHARTEGWAAGLRLAALSLAGHPDPERFAAEFSGSERTVSEYLLAEVLERQSEPVRRLLLRTSVLERVSGELAEVLTGEPGAERVLQDMERAGAFVVSLDARRSWFRYHKLFADLLQLELRRTDPAEIPRLHRAAAEWFAGHGFPVEAVRHAQAAQDWELAARLLSDHWVGLYLDGQGGATQELLAAFPATVVAADAELTALTALGELNRGSPEQAERHLTHASRGLDHDRLAGRPGHLRLFVSIVRLRLAGERVDPEAVAEEADRLLGIAQTAPADLTGVGADLRALVMVNLGIAETWAGRLEEAGRHLEQGAALGRRTGRPYIEFAGLAYGARVATFQSLTLAEQRSRQAIELAGRHGWGEDSVAAFAYGMLGAALTGQGRLAEAEPWLDRAVQTMRAEARPSIAINLRYARGLFELARGRHADALADLSAGDQVAGALVTPHALVRPMRALMVLAQVGLGETGSAEATLAGMDARERESVQLRIALAALRLARHDPGAAAAALAPVVDGSLATAGVQRSWQVEALLLESIARDALGTPDAAARALEHALEVAAPDRAFVPFLLHPVPELLKRHARDGTAHAGVIAHILGLLPGGDGAGGSLVYSGTSGAARASARLREPLSRAEARVLRYLPTSLSVAEIASQLYLSVNTVRTHMRHLYAKLDVHRRHEAVERARALGLLAPAAPRSRRSIATRHLAPGQRTIHVGVEQCHELLVEQCGSHLGVEHPAVAVRIRIDQLRLVGQLPVAGPDRAGDGRDQVAHALDRLDVAAGGASFDRVARPGRRYLDHVSE